MTAQTTVRHVILDRDGVLNRESPSPIGSIDDWRWETGALDGLELLASRGIAVSVATNQSAIGAGTLAAEAADAVHSWLRLQLEGVGLEVVGVFVCPHLASDDCACRKPRPGLLLDAVSAGGHSRGSTVMIGDDRRDLQAAAAAGLDSILVLTGKGATVAATMTEPVVTAATLAAAVRTLSPSPST